MFIVWFASTCHISPLLFVCQNCVPWHLSLFTYHLQSLPYTALELCPFTFVIFTLSLSQLSCVPWFFHCLHLTFTFSVALHFHCDICYFSNFHFVSCTALEFCPLTFVTFHTFTFSVGTLSLFTTNLSWIQLAFNSIPNVKWSRKWESWSQMSTNASSLTIFNWQLYFVPWILLIFTLSLSNPKCKVR